MYRLNHKRIYSNAPRNHVTCLDCWRVEILTTFQEANLSITRILVIVVGRDAVWRVMSYHFTRTRPGLPILATASTATCMEG